MDFFEFLNFAVTPYHTVDFLRREFIRAGFIFADLDSSLEGGKAYFTERGGALIAFCLPSNFSRTKGFKIATAHTDFPALKVSPNPDMSSAGTNKLHTEVYGSPLFTSWLDRDLGYAGMVAFKDGKGIHTELVRGSKLFRIPQLAVHLNRGVNQDGLKVNPQVDFDALWGSSEYEENFADAIFREHLGKGKLLDFEIQLFDGQPANRGGMHDEWIYSGRLDNLSSCHAVAEALISASRKMKTSKRKSSDALSDICLGCFFNNEEVGSTTREGAGGNFLKSVIENIWTSFKMPPSSLAQSLSSSLALSIDVAHALHPNHLEKHELNHAPLLGRGIVLKTNSQKRYASDLLGSAQFRDLCDRENIPLQTFISRNDMPCGSTVGPTVSASLGIPTVDIGEPILSMHSIRETMAARDHLDMIRIVSAFMG